MEEGLGNSCRNNEPVLLPVPPPSAASAACRGEDTAQRDGHGPGFPKDLDEVEFPALFSELISDYRDLNLPAETDLAPLDAELREARRKVRTVTYIVTTCTAMCGFATAPVILTQGYRAARALQPTVASVFGSKEYLRQHPEWTLAAVLACIGAVFYTVFMHQRWMVPRFRLLRKRSAHVLGINRADWRFIAYVVLINYLVAGVALLYVCSYTDPKGAIATTAVTTWLFLPVIPISFSPALLLITILVVLLNRYLDLYAHAPQAALLLEHLHLLHALRSIVTPSQMTSRVRRNIIRRIAVIARMFSGLYGAKAARHASLAWASRRMKLAADNFLVLASWIAFPKPDTIPEVKRRIVASANTIASGTYDMLPSRVLGEDAGLVQEMRSAGRLRRIGGLVALCALTCGPLAVVAMLVSYLRLDMPPAFQTPALIVYSAWIVLCLVGYLDRLAPEARTMILDLIRMVFRR